MFYLYQRQINRQGGGIVNGLWQLSVSCTELLFLHQDCEMYCRDGCNKLLSISCSHQLPQLLKRKYEWISTPNDICCNVNAVCLLKIEQKIASPLPWRLSLLMTLPFSVTIKNMSKRGVSLHPPLLCHWHVNLYNGSPIEKTFADITHELWSLPVIWWQCFWHRYVLFLAQT